MERSPAFKPLRFKDLPSKPRIAHDFFEHQPRSVPMHSIVFGPLKIHCHVRGNGPPMLLLHGLMTTSYSYRYLIPLLADHFTLYVPDLPGAGRSSMPLGTPYTPSNLAIWINEFQEIMGIQGCPCVGNSMAGFLAMETALIQPKSFSHLINIHSPAFPMLRLFALKAALSIPGAAGILHRIINRDPLRWAHGQVHYNDESLKSIEEANEYGLPLTTLAGSYAFYKYLYETMDPLGFCSFHKRIKALNSAKRSFPAPLTLIYAEQDPMVPPSVGRRLSALLPEAEMIWMSNSSHFAQVDTPVELSQLILKVLGIKLTQKI